MQALHEAPQNINPDLKLVRAVQAASDALPFMCTYTWERVNDDVDLIVLDTFEPMTAAMVIRHTQEVLMLKSANFISADLAARIERLGEWELLTVDGLIAHAAQWVLKGDENGF